MEVKNNDMIIKPQTPYKKLLTTYEEFEQTRKFGIQFVTGEAGSGKTSLVNLLLDEIAESNEDTLVVSGLCYIHSEYNIPYQPFKEILRELIQDVTREKQLSEAKNSRNNTIKKALSFTAKMICDHAPDLIGSFVPGASIIKVLGEHVFSKKETKEISIDETKILEQYIQALKSISGKYRIIIFIDDLQWIDNLSVNLLYQVIKGLKNHPVLFIGGFRSTDILSSGQTHPLSKLINEVKISHGNVFIDLDKNPESEKQEFLAAVLNAEPNEFEQEFITNLYQHTQGNPLFINELISLLRENNDIQLNNEGKWFSTPDFSLHAYPARIEGIIQERIGKLEESLIELLSHASIQGNHFIAQVLSLTIGQSEKDTLLTLSKTLQKQHNLVNETTCYRNGQQIISKFNFSNYIFRQYLYQELSFSQKMLLHSEVAGILEDIFKNTIEDVAPDIARHYELSGEFEKSFTYSLITIRRMLKVSAYTEANVLIDKTLNYLTEHDLKEEEVKNYFDLKCKKYLCLRAIKGWGNMEAYQLLIELQELATKISDYSFHSTILFGIWTVHLSRLELKSCLKIALENVARVSQGESKADEASALVTLINSYIWTGDLKSAEKYLEQLDQILSMHQIQLLDETFYLFFAYLVANEKCDYEHVSKLEETIRERIRSVDEPFIQAVLYQAIAWVDFNNNDLNRLRKSCAELLEISSKYNFVFYTAIGKIFQARYLQTDDSLLAEQTVKEGYDMLLKATDSKITIMHSVYGLTLSEIYLHSGQYEQFEATIHQIIEKALEYDERLYIHDLHLLKSDFFRQTNQHHLADQFMEQARSEAESSGSIRILNKQLNTLKQQL